jgi:hypothetical protein
MFFVMFERLVDLAIFIVFCCIVTANMNFVHKNVLFLKRRVQEIFTVMQMRHFGVNFLSSFEARD